MEPVRYETYEQGKGYPDIQARIYNRNTGSKVTGKEIELRIKKEKKDPNLLRYAFDANGNPLAYIQASQVSSSVFYLGFPWGVPECPSDVQEKMFSDMMDYLKTKNPTKIQYWIKADWEKPIEFFKSKGFEMKIRGLDFYFDTVTLSRIILEDDTGYSARLATKEDLELLLEIGSVDEGFKSAGLKADFLRDYFTNKVLADGHCILVFKDDKIVCTSAPLPELNVDSPSFVFLRFSATRPGYEEGWPLLVIEIAKECVNTGWRQPLQVNVEDGTKKAEILRRFSPKERESFHLFELVLKE